MSGFTIVGTGNMGGALAALGERAKAPVQSVAHGEEVDDFTGDIVVLAVPYEALGEVAAQFTDQLAGKIVVDISNPVDFTVGSAEGRRREIGGAGCRRRTPRSCPGAGGHGVPAAQPRDRGGGAVDRRVHAGAVTDGNGLAGGPASGIS